MFYSIKWYIVYMNNNENQTPEFNIEQAIRLMNEALTTLQGKNESVEAHFTDYKNDHSDEVRKKDFRSGSAMACIESAIWWTNRI